MNPIQLLCLVLWGIGLIPAIEAFPEHPSIAGMVYNAIGLTVIELTSKFFRVLKGG